MTHRSMRFVWLSASWLVIFGLVGGAWLLLEERRPLQVRRLPDGSAVSLDAVSRHGEVIVWGRRWQRLLFPLMPEDTKSLIGTRWSYCTGGEPDEMVFWISRREQGNTHAETDMEVEEVTVDGVPSAAARLCHAELLRIAVRDCWRVKVPGGQGSEVRIRFRKWNSGRSKPLSIQFTALVPPP